MEWYVYYDNINRKEITKFNIFDHGGFRRDFVNAAKKFRDKDDFTEEVRCALMYYFWSRSEYEVLVYPWPCMSLDARHIKIDFYEQIRMNWQAFADYVWEHREEVLADKG